FGRRAVRMAGRFAFNPAAVPLLLSCSDFPPRRCLPLVGFVVVSTRVLRLGEGGSKGEYRPRDPGAPPLTSPSGADRPRRSRENRWIPTLRSYQRREYPVLP